MASDVQFPKNTQEGLEEDSKWRQAFSFIEEIRAIKKWEQVKKPQR